MGDAGMGLDLGLWREEREPSRKLQRTETQQLARRWGRFEKPALVCLGLNPKGVFMSLWVQIKVP